MINSYLKIAFLIGVSLIVSLLLLYLSLYSILIIFLLAITIFFIAKKNWVYCLILLLVPIDRFYFPVFYHLKLYQAILLCAIILEIIFIFVNKKKKLFLTWNLLDTSVLLMYLGRVSSLFITINYASTIKALILYGLFVLLYFYIRYKAGSIEPVKMMQFMIYTSLIFIVFGFFEFVFGKIGIGQLQIAQEIYVYGGRPTSVFREPDWFGGYLVFIIGLTLPFIITAQTKIRKWYKIIFYLALVMSFILVVRSAWFGLLVGVLAVFVILKKSRKPLFPALIKIAVVIFLAMVSLSIVSSSHYKSVHDRFTSIFAQFGKRDYDPAAQVRLNSYKIITDYISQRPIQGYGAGAWEFLSQRHEYISPSEMISRYSRSAMYLAWLVIRSKFRSEKLYKMYSKSVQILGTRVDKITHDELLNRMDNVINNRKRCTVCFSNPYIIIESIKNNELRQYINESDFVVADGVGIILASKLLGELIPERVTGTDFMYYLSELSSRKSYKLYFLGAHPGVADITARNLTKMYSGLKIEGTQHGYFNEEDEKRIIEDIKEKKPDILIVCLGVPKQELWIKKHKDELGVPVIFGNGAAFDFVAGCFKRAPIWMQKCGLEWFFRLIQEPKRLWKRYLIGNIYFLFLVVKQKFGIIREN